MPSIENAITLSYWLLGIREVVFFLFLLNSNVSYGREGKL